MHDDDRLKTVHSLKIIEDGLNPFRLLCNFFGHTIALLQFNLLRFEFDEKYEWPAQFFFLLALSLVLSFLLVIKNSNFRIPLMLLRILTLVLISFPLGDAMEIKIILMTSLLIDINLLLPLPWDILLSLITISLFLLIQNPVLIFEQELAGASKIDFLLIVFYSGITIILTNIFQVYRRKVIAQQSHARRMDSAIAQLMKKNLQFQEHIYTVSHETIVKERKKISGEIHDIISYTLTNLLIILETVLALLKEDSSDIARKIKLGKKIARYGLREVRRVLHDLRTVHNQVVVGFNKIHNLAKSFEQATGTKIKIEYGNADNNLSEDTWNVLYHMVQEGMLNAFRHGKATLIQINFWKDDSILTVSINDNGSGCETIEKGIGLSTMEERIRKLGGNLSIKNKMNSFEIFARIPDGQDKNRTG
ncbi:MAG TPA: histidine kinase [Spirochaetia bacterium]|nr:histidine kinase [Spirochaetia bacterium]